MVKYEQINRKDMTAMKRAGHLCRIDKLGRIVIPKQLRDSFDIRSDDAIEIFTDDNAIILRKYTESCTFCGSEDNLRSFKGKTVCESCINELEASE